jgi:GAF domain-containing protein
MKAERQIAYLNTYLTVSSLLAQSLGLQDLMETVLYFCTDVVAAQEASVLLLDESRSNFTFYQTEGASRSVLVGKCFPADRGIAGWVLQNRRSEIVNSVQEDPRFYSLFDSVSGVVTRNMIAIPLIAGEETVGVLEVINKAGGLPFTDEDHLLLHFIADEISFGIRNARIFELLVNSYCKQRQGVRSCKDCIRPLGSWTPCVKQREHTL